MYLYWFSVLLYFYLTDGAHLDPTKISLVMAMGDSVTAAYAAGMGPSSSDCVIEERGHSWVTGGDPTAASLAKYFSFYSKRGAFSFKRNLFVPWENRSQVPWPPNSNFNAALSGATSSDLMLESSHLIAKLQTAPQFWNSNKLLVIFIGINDICLKLCPHMMMKEDGATPLMDLYQEYFNNIQGVLSMIQHHIPNTTVMLMSLPDITQIPLWVSKFQQVENTCRRQWRAKSKSFCPCFLLENGMDVIKNATILLNKALLEASLEHPQMVILNRAFEGINYNMVPITFFSLFDCYHPSLRGQAMLASFAWRALFRI